MAFKAPGKLCKSPGDSNATLHNPENPVKDMDLYDFC